MIAKNVIAVSGRAVEAAGDVDVLLLDKTGTITLGNRQASALLPAPGVTERELGDAAQLASLPDETPEGRSVVVLAKQKLGLRERDVQALHASFVKFSAQTRMSGVDLPDRKIRKGAGEAMRPVGYGPRGCVPQRSANHRRHHRPSRQDAAGRSRVVGRPRVLGVIELKDIVKGGIKERFAELRRMGIKTIMITGDNRLTAAAIAAEAGVDDFLAEATPEAKLKLIREHQAARPTGGDDRRRHQRRPGTGAGRCGGGDEHRHAGRQGSRQHGRSGFQPDQADRDRRDRQADADDARRADHVQHRQRRGQVFRHHPGGVRRPLIRRWAR